LEHIRPDESRQSAAPWRLVDDILAVVVAAVVLGAASTVGDLLWAGMSLRHRVAYGLLHGAAICLLIGAAVGWRAGHIGRGLAAGPMIGFLAAGVFYLLAPWLRYHAMFPAWMFFWICFALLQKWLRGDRRWLPSIWRGTIAASASGLAFYLISGIWTDRSPGAPNYLYNFGAWTFAFLPGFAALFARREAPPRRQPDVQKRNPAPDL
jgi:hypothetical protein